jgi:serine/threonine-protein kinase
VPVTDVTGFDQAAAANALGKAGFTVVKVTESSTTVAAGVVIRTEPAAGTLQEKGSTVKLVVSSGPEMVTVPNVVTQDQATATANLRAKGFEVDVVPVISSPANVGKVVAQFPIGGTSAQKGSVVTIQVGQGPGTSTTTTT